MTGSWPGRRGRVRHRGPDQRAAAGDGHDCCCGGDRGRWADCLGVEGGARLGRGAAASPGSAARSDLRLPDRRPPLSDRRAAGGLRRDGQARFARASACLPAGLDDAADTGTARARASGWDSGPRLLAGSCTASAAASRARQASTGPVQPDGEAQAGQAERLGGLVAGQAMPGQQRQYLAVALAQQGQGR